MDNQTKDDFIFGFNDDEWQEPTKIDVEAAAADISDIYRFIAFVAKYRDYAQRQRIEIGERLRAIEQNRSQASVFMYEMLKKFYAQFLSEEKRYMRDMRTLLPHAPLATILIGLRGVGNALALRILANVGDPARFETPSALRQFSGWGHEKDGSGVQRPTPGKRISYNPKAKVALYVAMSCMIKQGEKSPYYCFYQEAKDASVAKRGVCKTKEEQQKGGPWTPLHHHFHANRVAIQLFVNHLWEVARWLAEKPLRLPYVVQHMNHDWDPKLCASNFGWEVPDVQGKRFVDRWKDNPVLNQPANT